MLPGTCMQSRFANVISAEPSLIERCGQENEVVNVAIVIHIAGSLQRTKAPDKSRRRSWPRSWRTTSGKLIGCKGLIRSFARMRRRCRDRLSSLIGIHLSPCIFRFRESAFHCLKLASNACTCTLPSGFEDQVSLSLLLSRLLPLRTCFASAHVFCQCARVLVSCLAPRFKIKRSKTTRLRFCVSKEREGDSLNLYPCMFRFRESVFH